MAIEQKREQNIIIARESLKYQRFQASSFLAEIPTQDLFDAPVPAEPTLANCSPYLGSPGIASQFSLTVFP